MTKITWNGVTVTIDTSPEGVQASLAAPSAGTFVIDHNGTSVAASIDTSGNPQKALDFAAILQLILMILKLFFPDLGLPSTQGAA